MEVPIINKKIINDEISHNIRVNLSPKQSNKQAMEGPIINNKIDVDVSPPHKKGRYDDSIYEDSIEEEKYEWVEKCPPPEPPQPTVVTVKSDWIPPEPMKKKHEMTDEELWLTCPESDNGKVSIDTVKDKLLPVLKNYWKQLHESQGFDLDENPKIGGLTHGIFKCIVCEKSKPDRYKKYMTLSQFAIDETYNKDNKTNLKVLEVKSLNEGGSSCVCTYYLTFTAGDSASKKKTFQAKVLTCTTFITENPYIQEVKSCRLKAH